MEQDQQQQMQPPQPSLQHPQQALQEPQQQSPPPPPEHSPQQLPSQPPDQLPEQPPERPPEQPPLLPSQSPQQPLQQLSQQPPQQQVPTQPGVKIVTENTQREGYKLKRTALTLMKGLSIAQFVMGGFCMLIGIILLPVEAIAFYSLFSIISYGIWSGAYFIIVGGIGLGAVKYNTEGWITSTMVLNIISSTLFFPTLIALAFIGLILNTSGCGSYSSNFCSATNGALTLNGLLMLISIAELVITIWSAALCCGAVCSCCLPVHSNQQQRKIYPGTVPVNQVNSEGYQATTADPVPSAPTPENEFYDDEQTTPNQDCQLSAPQQP
ncbi:uncharacterized protein [Watersipora subatra]|uniref:uncharacterized protein n=1 Tax=Watersipora subatra TaxID=2589382 RepID=UPI00355B88C8